MKRGRYTTAAGSQVRPISEASWEIVFDWLEEGACIEAVPEVDTAERALFWSCACCDETGLAPLALEEPQEDRRVARATFQGRDPERARRATAK